jgi:CheY-like chemotaxis protein
METATGTKRVLVVEDDPDTREIMSQILAVGGYSVSTATNGREGLQQLAVGEPPCVILLDLMMPVMNGLEFLEEFRRNETLTGIPVIVVSAYHDMAQAAGNVAAFLEKPVRLRDLLAVVAAQCGTG